MLQALQRKKPPMLKSILKKEPQGTEEAPFIYTRPKPPPKELREIEKAYARLFASHDGQLVLSHLQATTFDRALGATSTDEQLRYTEGQRALVATVMRLIDRGRKQ